MACLPYRDEFERPFVTAFHTSKFTPERLPTLPQIVSSAILIEGDIVE